jgi:pantetheine-phosphate adenylyltransferase
MLSKMRALYPGTFDPPTLGHLDIILRAASFCDILYVAVGRSISKPACAFTAEERCDLLRKVTKNLSNVEVLSFDGLLVDCAQTVKAQVIIRALRNCQDFEQETMQASMNARLADVDTIFLSANEKYRQISSTLVREIARLGSPKSLLPFLPAEIEPLVFERLSRQ